jgi:hypothetical protein
VWNCEVNYTILWYFLHNFTVFFYTYIHDILEIERIIGILHSPVYTFFEKACIIELNTDVETGNLKLEIEGKYGTFITKQIAIINIRQSLV